jgi:MoxR-like ATPase
MILADEINRAPAKVQSALLEAMQEHQVTIGGETFDLPQPFMVMATQNPIEQEGTYPLPEAQIDRFMLKLKITYPSKVEERLILERMSNTNVKHDVEAVISPEEIIETRKVVDSIYVDDAVKDYIVNIVDATRNPGDYGLDIASLISFGASPRATIFLTLGAKAHAFMQGRGFVTPQDVKSIGADVLRHRVIISYEAEAEEKTSDDVVQAIFDNIEVP